MRYCINCKQWFDTARIDFLWVLFWLIIFFPVAIFLIYKNTNNIDCPVCGAITTIDKPDE